MSFEFKRVCCGTCKHTSRKGCILFKTSEVVWEKCLGGEGYNSCYIPDGWLKPMPYAYVFWQQKKQPELILPDELFDI